MAVLIDMTGCGQRAEDNAHMRAPTRLTVAVAGIGAWTRGALRALLRGEAGLREDAPARPAAIALPAGERRRAPESVLLAAEIAGQACAMARHDAARLPCVFASTHGELSVTDYMCATLASAPHELSPTRFHNSVHKMADDTPVLFAAYDIASSGPLAEMTRTTRAFGAAWVLLPGEGASLPRFSLALRANHAPIAATPDRVGDLARDNPLNAHALAFLNALAGDAPARLTLPAASGLLLDMEVQP